MKYSQRLLSAMVLVAGLVLLPGGHAHATLLDNWNVTELNASGDYIDLSIGSYDGNTTATLQWLEADAADPTPGALGIDQFYYNCEGCSFTSEQDDETSKTGAVTGVWENAIGGGGTDITSQWSLNYGGETAGGGFGSFSSRKDSDGGSNWGIDPNSLIFVLNGAVTFTDNGSPTYSTFAAHVRYDNECSGWASDGRSESIGSDASCGATQVPEPKPIALIGLGLVVAGFLKRLKPRESIGDPSWTAV